MLIKEARIPLKSILTIGILPSMLKIFYYRLRGAEIGRNVHIGFGSIIIAKKIKIGDNTRIGFGTIIRGKEVTIASYVRISSFVYLDVEKIYIDDDAKINELVFAGGLKLPESYLHIGKRALVMQMSFLNPTKPLIIGDDTGVGGTSLLFTHGVWQSKLEGYPVTYAPITLGKNVWLPWGVFIMPGVSIGDNATIGAASLVNKDVPAGALAVGVPAKVIKTSDEYPRKPCTKERMEIVTKILSEFKRYLEYHGLRVLLRKERDWDLFEIKKFGKKICGTLCYRAGDNASVTNLPRMKNSVFLSFNMFDKEEIKYLKQAGVMWVDLAKQATGGKRNDLGEEFLLFLERYGMRFERQK